MGGADILAVDPFAGLRAKLAAWRAEMGFDDVTLVYLIGVGAETCQRIEAAEVDPEPEVAARIADMFERSSVRLPRFSSRSDAARQRTSEDPAAVLAGVAGAAASPFAAAPPLSVRTIAPVLARGDGGAFHVELHFAEIVVEMTIDAAAALGGELGALVAVARDPTLYARQSRLTPPATG